jgi:Tfp pilus assembly protein PilO
MPDLRRTRKRIKIALGVLLGVDVIAVGLMFSPLIGSTESRRIQLSELWSELRTKTNQVEPLNHLDQKVVSANRQIAEFYKKRLPAQDSQIVTEFGKLAVANGVTILDAKYKSEDSAVPQMEPIEVDANLSGNYIALAKFINALERDDMLFIIDSIELGGEQTGPIKLQMKLETFLKAGAQ